MKKKFTPIINTILIFSFLIIALKINWPNTVTAAATTPSLPKVAIHISEYTQTLETLPASITTPRPPTFPNTTGYEWWLTAWHYRFIPESLIEALRSDGTQYDIITDADISNGNLLFADGSPKYPILISLASEAINDDEIAQLRAFVSSGGNLFIGSSSFTRNIDGSSRGNFVLSSEMGLNMRSDNLQNWYENETFTKVTEHRLVNHIPDGSINWFLPLTSEEIPLGPTGEHVVHQNHYAWAVNSIDSVVIAQGSSGPILTTKSYGDGVFIYYGILQPLVGIGGNDDGMYSYMIFRNAIEWAFERVNIPIVKISPWQYPYDSAFIVRHDFENDPVSIQSIESIAQSEQLKGVTGEYYFSTGVVRLGSEDHQLSEAQKSVTIQSLRRAISQYGAIIGSHNGGLPNPLDHNLLPEEYDYWHWGPDEVLDSTPPGYSSGQEYAYDSINLSFQDIEEWFTGLDNGRPGCGSLNNCPRVWVSPYFNSGRDGSFIALEQLGVITLGEQKIGPFPHWTLSTQADAHRYANISIPTSEWYVGSDIAQSLEQHTNATMKAGVDFYYDQGFLINFYGHGDNSEYSSYVITKPAIWSANSVSLYDWWSQRSTVNISPIYNLIGNSVNLVTTVSNATDPQTAIEIVIPNWNTNAVNNFQVIFDGEIANQEDYRITKYGVKIKVGNTVNTVEVNYDIPEIPPTLTPTPIGSGPITLGESSILGTDDYGNANLLIAQQADLGQNGTIQSLSFYVSSTSGQLRLGIYTDAGGNPGNLIAQTPAFTPVAGWNTKDVITPVALSVGRYWLAYLPQSNSLHYRVELTGNARGYSYSFGSLPSTFSSSAMSADVHWSLYATLLPETIFTPTPSITVLPTSTLTFTPTITKTATPSSTPTSLPTYTPTNTYTFTPTITNSSTPSSTPTPTLTLTSSPTNTITPSLVPSATFTQTSTATRTPTNTITSTFIPPTNTSIATLTSTYTGTATNTRTPTLLPTSTFTRTPTNTPVPSNTPSPTRTMTFTPTFTATSINTGPVLIGETDIVGIDDYGNANLLIAQQADLGQSGTIQSLSFYVTSTSGQLRLGIYADAGGRPGILLAQTAAFTPVIGWNTRNVITPVFMPAGSYWLAYLPQSNSLHYRVELTGTARGYSYSFGALPNSFSSSPMSADVHWSFYATIQ